MLIIGIDEVSKMTNSELLNIIFSNPFVREKIKDAAIKEYRRRIDEVVKEKEI